MIPDMKPAPQHGLKVLVFIALASIAGFAAEKPAPKDPKEKAKFYDQVTSIDEKSISLYRSPTKEAKFTITSATKVIVDYKPAKIEDVKAGMKATVTHKPDSDEATSINARTVKAGYGY